MYRLLLLALATIAGQVQAAIVCSIDPPVATNMAGDVHLFTITVTSDGQSVFNATVNFSVISGPNVGTTDSSPTDPNGEAVLF